MVKVAREVENFNAKEVTVSQNSVFNAILDLCIQNHAIVQSIVSNQADIMSRVDSQIDADEHFKECMQRASDAVSVVRAHVLSGIG